MIWSSDTVFKEVKWVADITFSGWNPAYSTPISYLLSSSGRWMLYSPFLKAFHFKYIFWSNRCQYLLYAIPNYIVILVNKWNFCTIKFLRLSRMLSCHCPIWGSFYLEKIFLPSLSQVQNPMWFWATGSITEFPYLKFCFSFLLYIVYRDLLFDVLFIMKW